NMDKMNEERIKKAIAEGHLIAEKIKNANNFRELDSLSDEIDRYCDFVNNNFSQVDDFSESGETYCELSFYLKIATETKERHLNYPHDSTENYGNEDVDVFENYLDSKKWLENGAK
ncbi:MAG: hypothetical protein Q4F56_02160, partial [Candidatus Saccharibacteria bacterium]|nr:hypothetical protein [Candidatus Saccharibacteria bacterium]